MGLQLGEVLGKIGGGGELEVAQIDKVINQSEGFQVLRTIEVDKTSIVAVVLTHDNTNSFGGKHGRAALAIRGADITYYSTNYGSSAAAESPLSIALNLDPGSYTVEAALNSGVGVNSFTAQRLTVTTTPL